MPSLVGRDVEIGQLCELLDPSGGGIVYVSGSAGMGKTSLIEAAVQRCAGGRVRAWGTCWHGDGAPAFWPWIRALDDLVEALGTDRARAIAPRDQALLAALVPAMGDDAVEVGQDERVLLFDAVRRFLEYAARERPVVLVLDDLQWADPSSVDLLDYVSSSPISSDLAIVAAYRHDEAELPVGLAETARRGRHVHLEGLATESVVELLAERFGEEEAALWAPDVRRRTGGHPFFVQELASVGRIDDGSVPDDVGRMVMARIEQLDEAAREILVLAAVLGNRLLLDVLSSATGRGVESVTSTLAPAIRSGVVEERSAGSLWFSHDLFRETIYASTEPARRVAMHGDIAAALEDRFDAGAEVAPGDLAGHTAAAVGHVGLERAILWARRAAAVERSKSAFLEAAAHVERLRVAALEAGVPVPPDLLVELLIEEADSLARSGHPDRARDRLDLAWRRAPDDHVRAQVALAVQRLGSKFSAPRVEVIEQLESSLAAVRGTGDDALEARLTATLARELWHSVASDRGRARPLSERALSLGRSADDETLVECLLARHDTLWEPGTGAERAVLGREIAEVGLRLQDRDRIAEGLLLESNALLECGSGGFRPVLDRWIGLLTDRNEPRDRYMVLTRRAALALIDGDADGGARLVDEAADLGHEIGEPDTGNVLMSQRVALAHVVDERNSYIELADAAVEWWTGAPLLAHAVAAGALAVAGELDTAAMHVSAVVDAGGAAGEEAYLQSVLVGHLAEAATALGDAELCRSLLQHVEPLVDSCGVNGAVVAFAGPFSYTAALLAGALGDADRANDLAHRAVATSRRLGASCWVQRSAALLDEARADDSDRDDRPSATLVRGQSFWTLEWDGSAITLPDRKGVGDLATLLQRPHREVAALELAGSRLALRGATDDVVDEAALRAYRDRLNDIDEERDAAALNGDLGRAGRLDEERDAVLAELRRVTGIGNTARSVDDDAERARKAVSARIRDALRHIGQGNSFLGAHLDRSIRTGLRCAYEPAPDEEITWVVSDER